jgi:aminoglycoside phosphotransferase (APT) family kinase protein
VVDSITKTRIDASQAEAVVARAFGAGVRMTSFDECEEGWFNAVHRLGLDDGRSVVLKIAPPPDVRVLRYEADIIRTEVDALRLVGERTEVPVPAVLAWDERGDLVPSPYFVMATCPGRLLEELRATLDEDAAWTVDSQVVRHVAAMNAITGTAFGRPAPSAPRSSSWREAFGLLMQDLLADATDASVDLPASVDEITAMVDAQADALDVVTTPRFVHWDLWDTNVFVDPTTWQVVGIIDFERVLWADPLMEAQFTSKRAHDRLVDAYGQPLFDEPFAVERRRLYDLYLYLVMFIECSYRNYPTPDIENFATACLSAVLEEIRTA